MALISGGIAMREHEQRAQFVRGVMRRTGSAAAPEWAPGLMARLASFLAVFLLGLALTLMYNVLHLALAGGAQPAGLTDALVAVGIVFAVSIICWRVGRIALATGIPFAQLVWVGSFSAPFLAFLFRAFHPEAGSRGWLLLGALALFAMGILPLLLRLGQRLLRKRRGYDEGHALYRSLAMIVFEGILLAGGVFAGFAWFETIVH